MGGITVDPVPLMKNVTITVKIVRTRELAFRIWLGTKLILLGARILGTEYEEVLFDG